MLRRGGTSRQLAAIPSRSGSSANTLSCLNATACPTGDPATMSSRFPAGVLPAYTGVILHAPLATPVTMRVVLRLLSSRSQAISVRSLEVHHLMVASEVGNQTRGRVVRILGPALHRG